MKKIFTLIFYLNIGFTLIAQPYIMCSDLSTTDTSGTLFDSGGQFGDYSSNENCGFLINPGCASSIVETCG